MITRYNPSSRPATPREMFNSVNARSPKGWKLVYFHSNSAFKMERKGKQYRITSGVEVFDEMTFDEATLKLGQVMMWHLRPLVGD